MEELEGRMDGEAHRLLVKSSASAGIPAAQTHTLQHTPTHKPPSPPAPASLSYLQQSCEV